MIPDNYDMYVAHERELDRQARRQKREEIKEDLDVKFVRHTIRLKSNLMHIIKVQNINTIF